MENEGVELDIEVEQTPAEVIKRHHPHLERAIGEAMKLLEKNSMQRMPKPGSIDRTSKYKNYRKEN